MQFYQVHKVRGGKEFERVSIRFDGAQYSRHLFFDQHSKIDPFHLTNGKVKLTPLISY